MTDNHKAYTSHAFQALLAELGARHILTPPYTPRWNGKVERFNQHPRRRMGHSRDLAQQPHPRPRPDILPALLQPPPTPHLTRRPATHQPRSPSPRAGQLARAELCQSRPPPNSAVCKKSCNEQGFRLVERRPPSRRAPGGGERGNRSGRPVAAGANHRHLAE